MATPKAGTALTARKTSTLSRGRSPATAAVVHHILAYAEDSGTQASRATTNVGDDNFFQHGEFLVEYSLGKGGEAFPEGSGRLLPGW